MYRQPRNYSQKTRSRCKVVAYFLNEAMQPVSCWAEASYQVNASTLDQAIQNIRAGRVVRSRA